MVARSSNQGLSGQALLNKIPAQWSAQWFQQFVTNFLVNADVRNAISGPGITITGNIGSPATIGATGTSAPAAAPVIIPITGIEGTADEIDVEINDGVAVVSIDPGFTIAYSSVTGTPTIPAGANPSASIGLSAINGSATTWMRSDGAPALSQGIAPTWTAIHIFANASTTNFGAQILGPSGGYAGLSITAHGQIYNDTDFELYQEGADAVIANGGAGQLQIYTGGSHAISISAAGLVSLPSLTASTGTTLIESGGAIYSLTSSRDYKIDIEDTNEAALANVLKLRPVWYRSNPETTSDRPDFSWYGLIAEEVHEIDPRLVNYWDQGRGKKGMKPKSVGYERIAPLLIPHVNRLYARVEALEKRVGEI